MRKRAIQIILRLTESEKSHLDRQAKIAGMKVNPFIRKLILGMEIKPRPPEEYAKILQELNAIKNDIKQIAFIANSTEHIDNDKINEAVSFAKEALRSVRQFR